MTPIKIIKNVITKDEASTILEYINTNYKTFHSSENKLCYKKLFGLDGLYETGLCEGIIDGLGDIKNLSIEIVNRLKGLILETFDENDDIFLNSLWFVKHLPGDKIDLHSDTAEGGDIQFVYSAVLYLNTLEDGGVLDFPKLNLSIKPEFGDLILFQADGEDMYHKVDHIGADRYTMPMWFTKTKDLELKFAGD